MGIGRADIVLNEQAAVVLGCRRAEAGMVELQRRRAIDAFHEGLDAPPSLFRKAVHPGAGNGLHRGRGLKLVDGAVGIHDDEVEAVARLAVPRSECRDQIAGNRRIVEHRELERGEPHLE
jgi:hypothetical protein